MPLRRQPSARREGISTTTDTNDVAAGDANGAAATRSGMALTGSGLFASAWSCSSMLFAVIEARSCRPDVGLAGGAR